MANLDSVTTLVHVADLHLGSPLAGLRQYYPEFDWHAPIPNTVSRLVRECVQISADVLLIAGDLADRDGFDDEAARHLHDCLVDLDDAGVQTMIVGGNHDATCATLDRLNSLPAGLPPSVHWFDAATAETVRLDRLGVAIHGRSLPAPTVTTDLTGGYPAPVAGLVNIGLLHTSLDGTRPSRPCAPTTAPRLVDTGYDYWALGHVHHHDVVNNQPWIVYAGNPQGRTPDESGPRGAVVVSADGPRVDSVVHVDLAEIRWERLRVDARLTGHDLPDDDVVHQVSAALATAADQLGPHQQLAVQIEIIGVPQRRRGALQAAIRHECGHRYFIDGITVDNRA